MTSKRTEGIDEANSCSKKKYFKKNCMLLNKNPLVWTQINLLCELQQGK